jgi:hypothetical protein
MRNAVLLFVLAAIVSGLAACPQTPGANPPRAAPRRDYR